MSSSAIVEKAPECPNCGAPLKGIGSVKCEYCGSWLWVRGIRGDVIPMSGSAIVLSDDERKHLSSYERALLSGGSFTTSAGWWDLGELRGRRPRGGDGDG